MFLGGLVLACWSCSDHQRGSELQGGVAGRDGYVLQLKRTVLPPGYKAPHNEYIREALEEELRDYFAFEVCPTGSSDGSQCFNPFRGESGELILNRFRLKRFVDPLMGLMALFEDGINGVAGTIDVLRDNKVATLALTAGTVAGSYAGHQWYQQRGVWTHNMLKYYLQSQQFERWWGVGRGALPSLEHNRHIALQAIRDSLRTAPSSYGAVRRAVWWQQAVDLVPKSSSRLASLGNIFTKAVYAMAALALTYLFLPPSWKQGVVHQVQKLKGWLTHGSNKGIGASYYLFGGHGLAPLPSLTYNLNKDDIFDTSFLKNDEARHAWVGVEVRDLIPLLAVSLASFRYYEPIDITHFCLPDPQEEAGVFCYKLSE